MSRPKKPFAYCTYDELVGFLPEEIAGRGEPGLLAMSQNGNYPEYVRVGTQRGQAYFHKGECFAHAKETWGRVFPELIQQMIIAGFAVDVPDISIVRAKLDAKRASKKKRTKKAVKRA